MQRHRGWHRGDSVVSHWARWPVAAALALAATSCSTTSENISAPPEPQPATGTATSSPATSEEAVSLADQASFPRRTGPLEEVTEGGSGNFTWKLLSQPSAAGTCLEVHDSTGRRTTGCGYDVPRRHDIGYLVHKSPGRVVVAGVVSAKVAAVQLRFARGADVRVQPTGELSRSLAYAVEVSPPRQLTGVIALDAAGREVERRPDQATSENHS
jgi:hypothetical protein